MPWSKVSRSLDSTEQGYAIVADGETVGLMIEERLDRVPHVITAVEIKREPSTIANARWPIEGSAIDRGGNRRFPNMTMCPMASSS